VQVSFDGRGRRWAARRIVVLVDASRVVSGQVKTCMVARAACSAWEHCVLAFVWVFCKQWCSSRWGSKGVLTGGGVLHGDIIVGVGGVVAQRIQHLLCGDGRYKCGW
jgi:hypothetical protein